MWIIEFCDVESSDKTTRYGHDWLKGQIHHPLKLLLLLFKKIYIYFSHKNHGILYYYDEVLSGYKNSLILFITKLKNIYMQRHI